MSDLGQEPKIIAGGIAIDDRGTLSFNNDFNFAGVKRYYVVTNHKAGFIRAWHAHRHEAKYVVVVRGSALVGAVRITDWTNPAKDQQPFRTVLSALKPSALYIPAGYANGFMNLTEDATMIFFSTSTLAESMNDDIRFESRYWDIWNVVER
jgi:dTDP-4-dehydrorhamnose 3,5-epimerase-like enzyme